MAELSELLAEAVGPQRPLQDRAVRQRLRTRARRRGLAISGTVGTAAVVAILIGSALRPAETSTVQVGGPNETDAQSTALAVDGVGVSSGSPVTVPADWQPLPEGVALVGGGTPGSLAGYVFNADLSRYENPPVYGRGGELVGYVVANVGFVAKEVYESPDFDPRAEEVRRYGEDAVEERERVEGQGEPPEG